LLLRASLRETKSPTHRGSLVADRRGPALDALTPGAIIAFAHSQFAGEHSVHLLPLRRNPRVEPEPLIRILLVHGRD
ncbi:MAG: hypothetical protein ACI8QF_004790, partial [Limisphaerales bacterium]